MTRRAKRRKPTKRRPPLDLMHPYTSLRRMTTAHVVSHLCEQIITDALRRAEETTYPASVVAIIAQELMYRVEKVQPVNLRAIGWRQRFEDRGAKL